MSIFTKVNGENKKIIKMFVGVSENGTQKNKEVTQVYVGQNGNNYTVFSRNSAIFDCGFTNYSSETESIYFYFTDNSADNSATVALKDGNQFKNLDTQKGNFSVGTKNYNKRVNITNVNYRQVQVRYVDKYSGEQITQIIPFPRIMVRCIDPSNNSVVSYQYLFNGQPLIYLLGNVSAQYGKKFDGWAHYNVLYDSSKNNVVVTPDALGNFSTPPTYEAEATTIDGYTTWVVDFYPKFSDNYYSITVELEDGHINVGGLDLTGTQYFIVDKTNPSIKDMRLASDTTKKFSYYDGVSDKLPSVASYLKNGYQFVFGGYVTNSQQQINVNTTFSSSTAIAAKYNKYLAISQAIPESSILLSYSRGTTFTVDGSYPTLSFSWDYNVISGFTPSIQIKLITKNGSSTSLIPTVSNENYSTNEVTYGNYRQIQFIVEDIYGNRYLKTYNLYWFRLVYMNKHSNGISKNTFTRYGLGIAELYNNNTEQQVLQILPDFSTIHSAMDSSSLSFDTSVNKIVKSWYFRGIYNDQQNSAYDDDGDQYDNAEEKGQFTKLILSTRNNSVKYFTKEANSSQEWYTFYILRDWAYKTVDINLIIDTAKVSANINTSSQYYDSSYSRSNIDYYYFKNIPYGTNLGVLTTNDNTYAKDFRVLIGWQYLSNTTVYSSLSEITVDETLIQAGTYTYQLMSRYRKVTMCIHTKDSGGDLGFSYTSFPNTNDYYWQGQDKVYRYKDVELDPSYTIGDFLPSDYTSPTGYNLHSWSRVKNGSYFGVLESMTLYSLRYTYDDGDLIHIYPDFTLKQYTVTVIYPSGSKSYYTVPHGTTVGSLFANNNIPDTYENTDDYTFYEWKIVSNIYQSLDKNLAITGDLTIKADVFKSPKIKRVTFNTRTVDFEIESVGSTLIELWKVSGSQMYKQISTKSIADDTVSITFDNAANMENGVICIAYRDGEYEGRLMTTTSTPTVSPSKNITVSGHLFGTTGVLNTGRVNGQQQGLGIYDETDFNTGQRTNKMVTTVTFHYPNFITFMTTGTYTYEMSVSFKGGFYTFVFT